MAPNDARAAPSRRPVHARTAAAARASLRPVAALCMGAYFFRIKIHVAKLTLAEHQGLIGEVWRCWIAARAAAHDGFGMNSRPKFHRRDKAVAHRSVNLRGLAGLR